MRTRTSLIATLLTLAVAAVTVPLATASPANDNRLVIGIKLTFRQLHPRQRLIRRLLRRQRCRQRRSEDPLLHAQRRPGHLQIHQHLHRPER
jgi:hypothetical protein